MVEIAEERARKAREAELKLLMTLFSGVMQGQIALAKAVASRPRLF